MPNRDAGRRLILISEDESGLRDMLALVLEIEGFAPTAVANGARAWERLLTEEYDLLITDWMMPELDGLALIKRIRSEPRLESLPILLTSAVIDPASESALQADAFIAKPYHVPTLLGIIDKLLDGTHTTGAVSTGTGTRN